MGRKKTSVARAIAEGGRFTPSAIAGALGISKSNLYEQVRDREKTPDRRHTNYSDLELLELIMVIVKERPTYGYRRVTACLNRRLQKEGRPRDTRYCSDTFEIWCWDNSIVRVAFVMDCCDREAISWLATTAGIDGAMIRDLMAEAVEARFGKVEILPYEIEWLSDNGSIYRSNKTREFAKEIGFDPCTTPAYSPESNGLAEAFVKTFKRDYVRVHDITTAEEVLLQLHGWFDDYNQNHPHKGLKMMSPREFKSQQTG